MMSSLTLVILMNVFLLTADTQTYAEAHQAAYKGKPMVVLVSTEWCAPCQRMKKVVLPEVRRRGLLKRVAFAVVNPDHNQRLAHKLTAGNQAIPQLIMYRKTANGWRRRALVGGQSADAVEQFIKKGIAAEEPSKEDQPEKKHVPEGDGPKEQPGGEKS
jgi:thioredoxin-like negative regulator of GroEL